MSSENLVETDVLVIGGGIAGCFAAIKAKEQGLNVTIVDKCYSGKAGSGIGANIATTAFNPEWGADFDVLMDTFIKSGEYINNREWCEVILKDSLAIFQDVVSWGVEVHPDWRESINMYPPFPAIRLKFRKYAPVLRRQAKKVGVRIMDRIMVTDLLKQEGKVIGAIGFSYDTCDLYVFKAKATVLTAGGSGFKPAGMFIQSITGDGEGMAYRAGAEITGKEFPSGWGTLGNYPLWGRATCGFVPILMGATKDGEGNIINPFAKYLEPVMDYHMEWKLNFEFLVHAGRGPMVTDFADVTDEAMRMCQTDAANSGYSSIDAERMGVGPGFRGKIPMAGGAPAGYSNCGTAGVWVINTKGATRLPGLYAAGDGGGTRYNGSYNTHPGTGGICPAAVTGRRAGAGAAEYALQMKKPKIDEEELARLKKIMLEPTERKGGFSPRWVTQLLQNTMTPYFILYIKHGERLQAALTIVEFLRDHLVPKLVAKDAHELRLVHETRNMVLSAEMQLRSSLFRTESRGVHYREDYPRRDDPAWLAWTKVKEEEGRMKVSKEPVPKEWWPDLRKPYEERYDLRFPGESEE